MRRKAIQGCDDLVSILLHNYGANNGLTIVLATAEHIFFMRALGLSCCFLIDMYYLIIKS